MLYDCLSVTTDQLRASRTMKRFILLLLEIVLVSAHLDYLDPTQLQTKTTPQVQKDAASTIIQKYSSQVNVEVSPLLFTSDKKEVFALRTSGGTLQIRATTGVAAVWGFNYYLKKYCKSHIGWQVTNVVIPDPLPDVDEVIVANDRLRYYQNVCTASYSFLWWNLDQWKSHVEWMALNGINLALAPIAQEAAWARIYSSLGMTQGEIDEHFTGPAFLSWLRMGNVRGWGGPLLQSWHDRQRNIQDSVLDYMFKLGIVPVLPAFSGHVPKAFSRIFPNTTFHNVETWNRFSEDYCCGLFLDPTDPLFKQIGQTFNREITAGSGTGHIYSADPFNEVKVHPWSTDLVRNTAKAVYSTLTTADSKAVWLLQNWMFVHDPVLWPLDRVRSLLTSVPTGRMLVLDLQSEQWPQYDLYDMYYGQPFIWCMLHNFGGTLGMFGNTKTINKDVYQTRDRENSTMIGIGLTPEGINQNYVVYDLMLESAWRQGPVDLNTWAEQYAERRYGCNVTGEAWRYLLKSVYSFNGLNRIRGKYVITRRPSMNIKPWAWYKSSDLIEAWRVLVFSSGSCNSPGYYHDLVDVTRQVLQYRAEQLYMSLVDSRYSNTWVYNASMFQFFDAMQDLENILASNSDFTAAGWLSNARSFGGNPQEAYLYDLNARNQITLWGPNGEITDYACKQWAELFHYYYIPRWRMFLSAALDAKVKNEFFDQKATQEVVRRTVERAFVTVDIQSLPSPDVATLALALYEKWAFVAGLDDLPTVESRPGRERTIRPGTETTLTDNIVDDGEPTVLMLKSTTMA